MVLLTGIAVAESFAMAKGAAGWGPMFMMSEPFAMVSAARKAGTAGSGRWSASVWTENCGVAGVLDIVVNWIGWSEAPLSRPIGRVGIGW